MPLRFVHSAAAVMAVAVLGCGAQSPTATRSAQALATADEAASAPRSESRPDDRQSPEAVFDAYLKAIQSGDWATAYACLTPAAQDMEVFEFCFELGASGSDLLDRHQDSKRVKQLEKAEMGARTDEESRAMIVGLLQDKRAFYVDASTFLADDMRRLAPRGPLRDVRMTGDRARGIATDRIFSSLNGGPLIGEPYPAPKYFAKSGSGWLLDFPTAQEQERDAQRPELYESGKVEAYHHCPNCGSLQGGRYGAEESIKEFWGADQRSCDHDWKAITLRQFKDLATGLFEFRWTDEPDEFWQRDQSTENPSPNQVDCGS